LTDSVTKVDQCLTTCGTDCGLGELGRSTGIEWEGEERRGKLEGTRKRKKKIGQLWRKTGRRGRRI